MYGSMAADHVVFDTMKSTNSMINDLIDEALKEYSPNLNGTNTAKNTIRDAIRAGIKSAVGGMFRLPQGSGQRLHHQRQVRQPCFDPIKYATVYGRALSKALSSKDAVNGIQAYMMYGLQRSAYEKLAQRPSSDLKTNVRRDFWEDYGFTDYTWCYWHLANWIVPGTTGNDSLVNLLLTSTGILHNDRALYHGVLNADGLLGADIASDLGYHSIETAVIGLSGSGSSCGSRHS